MPRPTNLNEEKLFNLIKEWLIPDLEKSEEFDRHDCTSKLHKMMIELKCRSWHYDDLLIEKKKYFALLRSGHKNIRYICSTPKGVYSFNLSTLPEPEWKVQDCKKDTEFSEGLLYIPKVVGFFNIKDSIEISEWFK